MSHVEVEIVFTQRENQDKAFLVRESITVENALVVSAISADYIRKDIVRRNDRGGYTVSGCTFSSIDEYIEALRLNGHITVPCKRDDWECGKRLLTDREERIVTGRKSVVFEGQWTPDGCRRIAVKSAVRELNETSQKNVKDIEELLACAKLLKTLNHPQIVKLLGVRSSGSRLCIATEFMERGSLAGYLRTEGSGLRKPHLFSIAKQICKGMRYLSEDMIIVHRKLTASNVLSGANPVADVRLTGFSSALSIPPGSKFVKGDENDQLPIKWLAPESLKEVTFSVKSDVWSFGMVLFELVTHGGTPYPLLKNERVMEMVCAGWQMPRPVECPEDVYNVMSKCWAYSGEARPSFLSVQDQLERLVMQSMAYL